MTEIQRLTAVEAWAARLAFALIGAGLGIAGYMAALTFEADDLPALALCLVGLGVEIALLMLAKRRKEA